MDNAADIRGQPWEPGREGPRGSLMTPSACFNPCSWVTEQIFCLCAIHTFTSMVCHFPSFGWTHTLCFLGDSSFVTMSYPNGWIPVVYCGKVCGEDKGNNAITFHVIAED